MHIGFFDSGIGGITVLYQTLKLLPHEDYIYYADTLHVPYGEKPKHQVRQFIFEAVDFIAHQGVKALVVACNTATSAAINDLRKKYDFPIIGIEPAVKPAIKLSEKNRKRVLVLATRLTLQEEKFTNLVRSLDEDQIVDGLPLPELVNFAEKFEFNEKVILPYLKRQLSKLDLNQYEVVVLGCTHFPFYKDILAKIFPPCTAIIDGSYGTANNLRRILTEKSQINEGTGKINFYNSGQIVTDKSSLHNYQLLFDKLHKNDITV